MQILLLNQAMYNVEEFFFFPNVMCLLFQNLKKILNILNSLSIEA